MRRGDLYRVYQPRRPITRDPRKYRVFVVVSRQTLVDSRFTTVICAPVYTAYEGLYTQISIGPIEGMKHECSIHCDELVSLPKSVLTDYVGTLSERKMLLLNQALRAALQLYDDDLNV